jgi:hypothetical protein
MARFSETAKHMKLEAGDVLTFAGVKAKVLDVMIIKSKIATDVLIVADLTRGTGEPNIFHVADVESVKVGGEWWNMKGEVVTV